MDNFIRVMKALSDRNRVKMIKMLQRRSMCVCELRKALGIAQPTASNHLKVLEDAGLVSSKKDGLWVDYSASDGEKNPYAALVLGALRHWLDEDPNVSALLKKLPEFQRDAICALDKVQRDSDKGHRKRG